MFLTRQRGSFIRAVLLVACVLSLSSGAKADPSKDTAEAGSQEELQTSPSLPSNSPGATEAPPPSAAQGPAPSAANPDAVRDDDPRALEAWRPQLDPYGAWVDDPKYGRIWVPDRRVVGEGFSPYVTSGHWALDTDNNWVWVSDFEFGNIVFHYGRWVWTAYGWAWVPGYQYSPAWVVWRVPTGPYAYVGWAPAPPLWGWWGGVAVGFWTPWPYYWVFCPSVYAFSPYPYRYVVTNRTYVRTLGTYTRNYVPASPRVGPSLQAARVPANAAPQQRISTARAIGASRPLQRAGASPALSPSRATSLTRSTAPRAGAPATSRALPPRVAAPNVVYAPSFRGSQSGSVYRGGGAVRPYSGGAPGTAPRSYAPSRSYSSPAPSRPYSSPGPGYAPSRPYSAPSYSAPRGYSPPSRVYSPSAPVYSAPRGSPSPSFGGGGGRGYGGGGRGGGGGRHR